MLTLRMRIVWLAACAALAGGCAPGQRVLSALGVGRPPLVVAHVIDDPAAAVVGQVNPFPDYEKLRAALSKDLGRPVSVDVCLPFQAESGLDNGWYALAFITPHQWSQFGNRTREPLAVRLDAAGRETHSALLIVKSDAAARSAADLRQKVIAFGPANDSRTHIAALQALEARGLKRGDWTLDLLPVPGSLKHIADARAAGQALQLGLADAAFVDELEFAGLPATAPTGDAIAQTKFRVLDRTAALPTRLVLRSPKLADAEAALVREALLAAAERHPAALQALRSAGFRAPSSATVAACAALPSAAGAIPRE